MRLEQAPNLQLRSSGNLLDWHAAHTGFKKGVFRLYVHGLVPFPARLIINARANGCEIIRST
jgi:hypothetical protein